MQTQVCSCFSPVSRPGALWWRSRYRTSPLCCPHRCRASSIRSPSATTRSEALESQSDVKKRFFSGWDRKERLTHLSLSTSPPGNTRPRRAPYTAPPRRGTASPAWREPRWSAGRCCSGKRWETSAETRKWNLSLFLSVLPCLASGPECMLGKPRVRRRRQRLPVSPVTSDLPLTEGGSITHSDLEYSILIGQRRRHSWIWKTWRGVSNRWEQNTEANMKNKT